ncbi:MAG TPA: ACT domain-containing protein, partial [Sphingomonadales bacterium]|nr:ACT domain-containing protein [Sphingomonadales bacterium]
AEEAELSIKGLTPGMALHLAECCHPLPGDRIVGVVEAGKGVVVHTIDCENLENVLDKDDSLLDLSWQAKGEKPGIFAGRVEVVAANEAGVLANIATVVAKHDANISNLKITARDPEFFTMRVDIEVRDVKHLTGIITALRTLGVVSSAKRLRG